MKVVHEYQSIRYVEFPGVYPVSEDSILLLRSVEEIISQEKGRLMDMGCGVGLITLKAASGGWEVIAVDREPRALQCLNYNLSLNSLEGSRTMISDLFNGIPRGYLGYFDLITFNPPYVEAHGEPVSPRDDLALSGGYRGTDTTLRFLRDAFRFISDHGKLLLLGYGSWPVEDWISEKAPSYSIRRTDTLDLDGEEITIFLIGKKNSRIGESLYCSDDNSMMGGI